MSLADVIAGWERRVQRGWQELAGEIPEVVGRASSGSAYDAVSGYITPLMAPVLVVPGEAARALSPLAPLVDRAAAEVDAQHSPAERVAVHAVGLMNLGNALQSIGCDLGPGTIDRFRGWVSRLDAGRNDPQAYWYWSGGFAALALDERVTYRRYAGRGPKDALSFQPGQTFEFNLQGLMEHLAAAIEAGAKLDGVRPAWQDFLRQLDKLRAANTVDPGTVLWIARVVHHRIGGAPLGQVARRAHDDIWQLASS
jgi:hypothetical protein